MKKIYLILISLLMLALPTVAVFSNSASAAPPDQPEVVVSKFINLVQKQRNYDQAADFIDWSTTYRRLGQQQQVLFALLQIGSAQRLREISLVAIKDPRNFLNSMTSELTQGFSFLAHSDELLTSQLQPLLDPYLNEIIRSRGRLEHLSFGPPQSRVNGSLAMVQMTATERSKEKGKERNQSSTVLVPLVSNQGRWLINPLDVVVRN